ncbi:MAG: hypothetical protein ACF8NJ_08500 [Phycisphaerales bacterium JB038]
MRIQLPMRAMLTLLSLPLTCPAQSLLDTFTYYSLNAARQPELQFHRLIPGAPFAKVASFSMPTSGTQPENQAAFLDPRTGELWIYSDLVGTTRDGLARYDFQAGRLTATGEEIEFSSFGGSTLSGADFDDDGNFVACSPGGLVYTVDLLRRQIVKSQQLQGVSHIRWFVPARRGRAALAEFEEIWPSPYQSIATFREDGSQAQVVHREFNSNWPTLISLCTMAVTTDGGRTFVTGIGPMARFRGLYELNGANLIRDRRINGGAYYMLEDTSRGVLHLSVVLPGGENRAELDLDRDTFHFLYDPGTPSVFWSRNLGWFPRDRLMLSPTRPTVGAPFDAVLALGGEPGALGLVLFRHASVGGVVTNEINSVVALGTLDSLGLQRTVLPYDPAVIPLSPGDELIFQGFTLEGTTFASTAESSIRWR